MAFPAPVCVPSGNAPPSQQPLGDYPGYQSPRNQGVRQPGDKGRGRRPPRSPQPSQEEYVRLAHRNYVENPPLRQCRVPCREHRKIRVWTHPYPGGAKCDITPTNQVQVWTVNKTPYTIIISLTTMDSVYWVFYCSFPIVTVEILHGGRVLKVLS